MSFEFEAPEDVEGEGGNYLSEPGTFHMVVTQCSEGEGPKGGAIDGFTIHCDVMAGTVDGCGGQVASLCIFAPDMSRNEGSQLKARRQIAAALIATDLLKPEQLGKPCKIDLETMAGRQLVVKLGRKMTADDEGKYTVPTDKLEIDYASIYHVDDPAVEAVPKSDEALALIPAEYRHDASWFSFKKANGAAKKPKPAVAVSADDIDDI